jgi:hypothetical protein
MNSLTYFGQKSDKGHFSTGSTIYINMYVVFLKFYFKEYKTYDKFHKTLLP